MNTINTSSEPPSKCLSLLDVECIYADALIPSDKNLNLWVHETFDFLVEKNALEAITYELSIRIVDKVDSQQLNNQFRNKNKSTNVLSFPFEVPEIFQNQQDTNILGDIVICAPIVEEEAIHQNKTIDEHWAHMTVHGVLHLLGYDHMNNKEAQEMENLEIKILSRLGYRNPYMDIMQ